MPNAIKAKCPDMAFLPYIIKHLQDAIGDLPLNFYDTFTKRGGNLTHPITIGLLAHICYCHPLVKHVGVDVRLNDGQGNRFNPDIVAYSDVNPEKPVLFIDYESPNSCDSRILGKDIEPYEKWAAQSSSGSVPYIIITTLPNKKSKTWKLMYVKANNSWAKGKEKNIQDNPFKFWKQHYKKYFKSPATRNPNISMLNISAKSVTRIKF